MREKELLDYHYTKIVCGNDDQIKSKKKIINEIKRKLNKIHSFYISWHAGKDNSNGIKRLHLVDENKRILTIYANYKKIEQELSKYNEAHFKKAYNTIVSKDKYVENWGIIILEIKYWKEY